MDHLPRIQSAVDFIESHLKEELRAEGIAKEAALSRWHFQRVFRAAVGETLMDYVRKRRLTCALLELTSSDRKIIDIAFEYQFESQEAFTRSFKALFGINPGECRKQAHEREQKGQGTQGAQGTKLSSHFLGKPKITAQHLDHLYRGTPPTPRLEMMPERKVVGFSALFVSILSPEKTNHLIIPKLWENYLARAGEIKFRLGPSDLGVCEPRPEDRGKDICWYMAGTEVSSFTEVPEGMESKVVPAGRYAVFEHHGKLDGIEMTMNAIYGSWLPQSGHELREAPDLEVYDKRFAFGKDSSILEICIPIT